MPQAKLQRLTYPLPLLLSPNGLPVPFGFKDYGDWHFVNKIDWDDWDEVKNNLIGPKKTGF